MHQKIKNGINTCEGSRTKCHQLDRKLVSSIKEMEKFLPKTNEVPILGRGSMEVFNIETTKQACIEDMSYSNSDAEIYDSM